MSTELKFAIAIPQIVADGTFDPAELRAYLERAEALGFESAWTMEQVLGYGPMLAPAETMAFAAALSDRIRIGCVVFVTPMHNPVHLAKSLSTLDQLSRGRLEIGVGIGGGFRPLAAFGVDPSTLVAQFNEGLQVMKTLWTEPQVTFGGRFWQLEGVGMEPKPLQKPYPPVWFGASHPDALRRAARHGDGFFGAGSTTTAAFATQVPIVRAALAEFGRAPDSFRIAKRVYIAVDDDAARAQQRMADALVGVYGEFGRGLAPVAVTGPPAACIEGVREVAAAGARLILLHALFDQPEQMERLAAEVVPALAE